MRLSSVVALLSALSLGGPLAAQPTASTELHVLASNGVKAVIEELRPELEHAADRPLAIEFSTAASLETRIEAGTEFDVALLTPAIIDTLAARGLVVTDTRQNFARVGVGVGARAGHTPSAVGTAEELKQTLLAARSIAYTGDGQSRVTIDRAFERLGIVEPMRAKSILKGPGQAPAAVAAGEADLVLTLVSEILPVPGLELLGPLPPDLQGYVAFTGARARTSADPGAADAVLAYLASARVRTALRAHGMEAYAD